MKTEFNENAIVQIVCSCGCVERKQHCVLVVHVANGI